MTLSEKIRAPHRALSIRRRGQVVPRDVFLDAMTFARPAPPMFTEIFGPLPGVKDAWRAQGATADDVDLAAFPFRFPEYEGIAVSTGFLGGGEPQFIEETANHLMYRDGLGRTMKLSKSAATLALPMDWPVASMGDWDRIREHYAYDASRFASGWLARARQAVAEGRVLTLHLPGGFDTPRQLMGDEAVCYACYEQPELLRAIVKTITETALRVIDEITAQIPIDMLDIHEDMAGRAGPMWGPQQVREFMCPYYRAVWDRAAARGTRLFRQDSDGDMTTILPDLIDAGLNFIYPVEPTGRMDPVALRRQYPRLAMMGGIDKYTLLKGPQAIDAELEGKLPALIAAGGYVIALDHRIPNGVTLESYRHYYAKVWEIIDREAPPSLRRQAGGEEA
jgi:hypothetical protein